MINTTSERLNARNFFICWYFSFYEQLKFGTWIKLQNANNCHFKLYDQDKFHAHAS